ncbi:MAG TPA: TetR/AcrR family transcriptional regulator [Steroidobacteraceae bacterium]|jgi:TetR/AcrR family transcriptional repressor of bet genes
MRHLKKKSRLRPPIPRARNTHSRQRQKLIDACISALHIYGPSRTTVEKVVAIADMSPGIVRFYFASKASMLVASLQFLATEFEQQLLVPVGRLKANPVAALQMMVDLYLDAEIASPRKVSVWYAFWGEASSRQEYYDICGKIDERFAALVHELIERLIIDSAQPHLDPKGIALGLMGALEMLWQDFAFRTEADIDRPAAKQRCMAYLQSVFPGQFSASPLTGPEHAPPGPRVEAGIHVEFSVFLSGTSAGIVSGLIDSPTLPRVGETISFLSPKNDVPPLSFADFTGLLTVEHVIHRANLDDDPIRLTLESVMLSTASEVSVLARFLEKGFGLHFDSHGRSAPAQPHR